MWTGSERRSAGWAEPSQMVLYSVVWSPEGSASCRVQAAAKENQTSVGFNVNPPHLIIGQSSRDYNPERLSPG